MSSVKPSLFLSSRVKSRDLTANLACSDNHFAPAVRSLDSARDDKASGPYSTVVKMSRRLFRYGIGFALILATCGCGGLNGNVNVVSGTFVGTASDGSTIVAIDAQPSAGGTSRTVSAFATSAATTSEFFTGTVNGNLFDLHSDTNDAEISGTLDSFGANASLTMGANPSLSVNGNAIAGATGLFLVNLVMPTKVAGTVSGISSAGAQLSGTIPLALTGNSYAVTGTITAPGGEPINFSCFITKDSSGQQHWIVLSDESVHGGPASGAGTGFASATAF